MAVFSEAFRRLRENFDQAQLERQNLIRAIQNDVREMARQTGTRLAEQGKNRRAEFAAMIDDLRGKIKAQAERTRGQLGELAADLRQGGGVFGRRQQGQPRRSRGR
jgi:hypothetical protein